MYLLATVKTIKYLLYQWRITPAIMNKLVIMYVATIAVLIIATLSASLLVVPDFSPNAFAHILQADFMVKPFLLLHLLFGETVFQNHPYNYSDRTQN